MAFVAEGHYLIVFPLFVAAPVKQVRKVAKNKHSKKILTYFLI
jgi:hypothetical protein